MKNVNVQVLWSQVYKENIIACFAEYRSFDTLISSF